MCSVALSANGELVALKERNEPNIHAREITLFINSVMRDAGIQFNELCAVAVSKGPGSYTGLRIGVSAAKGICFALDLPLIAVDTLEAMAGGFLANHPQTEIYTLLCPMIDARRMEVYCALFNNRLSVIEPVEAKILDQSSYAKILDKTPVIFFGDGARKTQQLFADRPNYRFVEFENSAAHLSRFAFKKWEKNHFENMAYFEPFYLKEFIAGISAK